MSFNLDQKAKRIPILGGLIRKLGFVVILLIVVAAVLKFSEPIKEKLAGLPVVGPFFSKNENV